MKLVKALAILLVLLFVLAVAGVVVGPMFVDWGANRGKVEAMIKDATGYQVVLKGDIVVKTLPKPYVQLGGIEVLPHTGDRKIFAADNIRADISLPHLFSLQLAFEQISLSNTAVVLARDAAGAANWENPATKGKSSGDGTLSLGPVTSLGVIVLDGLRFTFDDQPMAKRLVLEGDTLRITGTNLDAVGVTLKGRLNGLPLDMSGTFNLGTLASIGLDTRLTLAENRLKLKGLLISGADGGYVGDAELDMPKPLQVVRDLRLMDDVPNVPAENMVVSGSVKLMSNLRQVDKLRLRINDMQVEGDVLQRLEKNAVAELTAKLNIDKLDLDAYLPAPVDEAPSTGGAPWTDDPIDLSAFQKGTTKLDLTIGKLTYKARTFDNVRLRVNAEGSTAAFDEIGLDAGKGQLRGRGRIDIGTPARYNFNFKLTEMPLESLLGAGAKDYFRIPLNADTDFQMSGNTSRELVSTLSGKLSFNATQGTLVGLDVADLAIALQNFISDRRVERSSILSALSGSVVVDQGVVQGNDFTFKSGDVEVTGGGRIDLGSWTVNYRLRPVVASTKLGSVVLPVTVRGPLNRPAIVPDLLTPQGIGAGVGALIGGPVGAAVGNVLGTAAEGTAGASPTAPVSGKAQLPFDFNDKSNLKDNVRKFLDQLKSDKK